MIQKPWMSNGGTIESADGWHVASAHGNGGDQLANARLIAAAPEMLEVIKDAVKTLEDTLETQRCSVAHLRTLNIARAVIEKARGER